MEELHFEWIVDLVFEHMHKPSIAHSGASVSIKENGSIMVENEGIRTILDISP